jgi:hypothetical protein
MVKHADPTHHFAQKNVLRIVIVMEYVKENVFGAGLIIIVPNDVAANV